MAHSNNPQSYLIRRFFIPLLIVALPILAMVAFILYHKKTATAPPAQDNSQTTGISFGTEHWTIFRGDSALTGQAEGSLPDTLKLAWKFQTQGEIKSTAVVADDTVFVSSLDKKLYALDLRTGKKLWQFEADDELEASPLYHETGIYIGSAMGTFYAIDLKTHQPKWTVSTGGKIVGSANLFSHPQTNESMIIFGSYDNNLYCYNALTGEEYFKYPAQNYINGSVAIINNIVAFGSCDANVYLVPVDNLENTQTIDAESYVAASPALYENTVYTGNYEGRFFAADMTTQKVLWQYTDTKDAFFSSPAVNAQYVAVGCRDAKLYCFDRLSGEVRWTFTGSDSFDSSPVICGDKVAVGGSDGRLYIVDLQSGKELFSYTLGSPVASSPAIAQNHLLIGCDNGILYAFTEQ